MNPFKYQRKTTFLGYVLIFIFAQAGNVVTGEMVEELILAGADIIKVGIGPGEPYILAHSP